MTERERNESDATYFNERYDVRSFSLGACDRPLRLRDHGPDEPQVCRFCGKRRGEVPFKKEAHAAPRMLGNRCLISLNECDVCNQLFGATIEDQLSKALGPMRTMSQVPGRRGIPSYNSDGSLEVRVAEGVAITVRDSSKIADDGDSQLDLKMATQEFVPEAAAKSLVKIACSLAEKQNLPDLAETIRWLKTPTAADAALRVENMPVMMGFVPGPSPYGLGVIHILTRKAGVQEGPYMWVVIGFGNCQLQVPVPFCKADSPPKDGKLLARFFPLVPSNNDLQLGPNVRATMDWSGVTPIRAEITIGMHYELRVKLDSAQPSASPA